MAPRLPAVRPALAALSLVVLGACATDDTVAPTPRVAGEMTVDASTGWVYVSLADSAVVTPPDPTTSGAWDIAFRAQATMLNGGQAGPGGVTGACLCQNTQASPTSAQLYAQDTSATLRAAELAEFDAVAAVPASLAWDADSLAPAMGGWVANPGASATLVAGTAWVVRLANVAGTTGSTGTAKVRVAAIEQPTATSAGRVTLEFAVSPAGQAAWGATRTLTVDVSGGAKSVDLDAGAETTSPTDWDVRLQGWTIRTNGGVSGTGGVLAATLPQGYTFASIAPGDVPPQGYVADAYTGIFGTHPWNVYNLVGNHRVTPTYDVYFVRRGATTYKLQVVSYYSTTGQSRRITFRYAAL